MTTITAGIYARISEDRDNDQTAVGRQIKDATLVAENLAWPVHDEYVDNDVSAYKGGRRPAWEHMLTDIADGTINAVIVYHQDRLLRQPRDLERFFDVCDKAGLTHLASASGAIVDLTTGDGRMQARVLGAVAANQSDAMSRRLKRKYLAEAQGGAPATGGPRPFGFESDRITVRPDEAEIIRDLAERLLAGESLQSLCRSLNDRSIPTTAGNHWRPHPLRRLLRSGRISGQREHDGEIVAKAQWPAIITSEQTTSIRAMVDDPSRRGRAPRSYPLRGLLRCSRCEATLISQASGKNSARRYVCSKALPHVGCGRTVVLAEPVELFLTETIFVALDTPALADAIRDHVLTTPAGEWQRRADEATETLEELAGLMGRKKISMREWLAAREPLEQELELARKRVARSSSVAVLADHLGKGSELRERWPSLGVDRQHAIVSAMLYHVNIKPALRGRKTFDPDRFEPIWRH